MRRPQNLNDTQLLSWIMNNELQHEPDDFEKDCWIAADRKCIGKDNRPHYYYKGKKGLMYRQTWMMWNDQEFPEGMHARHLCGEPRCINPLHIQPGTPRENEADKKSWSTRASSLPVTPAFDTDEEKVNFWLENHVEISGDCLLFLGSVGADGYGRRNVMINGLKKNVGVHRWVYSVLREADYFDKSWIARHTCNNRSCINPNHMIPGDRVDNARDARNYSRAVKLSEEQVREIIKKFLEITEWPFGSKKSFAEKWAERYGVSKDAIYNIVFKRRCWKDTLKEYGLL